jgi:hypothetical protein
LTAE